jgi:DNA-binding MarR family transcriptional regulator
MQHSKPAAQSLLLDDPVTFSGTWMNMIQEAIETQGQEILSDLGVLTPARCVSVFLTIAERGPVTTAELARWHGYSHQLMSIRIAELTRHGLIKSAPSKRDARKLSLHVTRRGAGDLRTLTEACKRARAGILSVFEEAGLIDPEVFPRIAKALSRQSLKERSDVAKDPG